MKQYFALVLPAALAMTAAASADPIEYVLDNGTMATAVGPPSSFPVSPEMMWGNYYTAQAGGEVITTISAAFGPTYPEDVEVTVALFDDPDDDGDPRNATFVASATGVPEQLGGSHFTDFAIQPTQVSGGFFVAVIAYTEKGEDRPAAMGGSGNLDGSWMFYNPASKGINVDDPGANALAEAIEDVSGFFTGRWMVRASGTVLGDLNTDGSVNVSDMLALLGEWGDCEGEICPADLNGDGAVNVSDLLTLLGNWG